MTIEVETTFSWGVGNGVTRVWPYSFTLLDDANLHVFLIDNATGETLATVPPGEYSVEINEGAPGGSVTYPLEPLDPLDDTRRIGMMRVVPFEQDSDINNQGGFHPNIIENQMDLIVMMIQQLGESDARSLKVDPGMEPVSVAELVASTLQAIEAADTATAAASASEAAALAAEDSADSANTSAIAAAASAADAASNTAASIRWDVAQTLTEPQQAQAAANMGLGSMALEDTADYTPTSGLSAVATSGAYADLTGKPDLSLYQPLSAKGIANGYASLGADGKVPSSQIPVGGSYLGNWDASTNTPTVTAGVGNNGDEYTVSVAGTQSVTGSSTAFSVGDRLKFTTNGNKWERIPAAVGVSSWAGKTGAVVPVAADIADLGTAATTDASDYATAAQGTLATNAVPNTRTVNGKQLNANITITKGDVGLGNVDNTSDANKPISTATQTALDLKVPTSRTVSASTGLTGGGSLAGNIALALSSTSIASLALADSAMQQGDFGFGVANGSSAPLLADLDLTSMDAGRFRVDSSTAGVWPTTNKYAGMVDTIRYAGGWIEETLVFRADAASGTLHNEKFRRTYLASGSPAWRGWERELTAENLRNPPSEITSPLMHFERSIPLNFWELGIKGHDTNPTVDEGSLITAAITKAITERRKLVIPATLYLSSGTLITSAFELEMEGIGGMPFILPTDSVITSSGGILRLLPGVANADWLAYGTLSGADRGVGGRSVTLPSSWNGTVGDCYVGLTSDKLWYWDARSQWYKGEFHRVVRTGSGGTQLYFEDNTHDSYDSGEVVNYRVWKANRLDLHNIGFGNKSWTTPNGGLGDTYDPSAIEVRRTRNMNLDKIETYGFGGTHIVQRACEGTVANDIYMWGGGYTTEDDGGGGYGMSHLCCKNARYSDIRGGGMRRLIDFSGVSGTTVSFGPSRNCLVEGFHAWGGGRQSSGVDFKPHGAENSFGVGTHGPADGITWRNGIIENVGQGITVRGQNITIENVEFRGRITENCIGLSYAQGVTIKNNQYNSGFYGKTDEQSVAANYDLACPVFVQFGNESGSGQVAFDLPTVVEGNTFDGLTTAFAYFGGAQNNDLQDSIIINNHGRAGNASADTFYMFKSNTGQIQARGCEIYENTAVPASGNNGAIQHDDGLLIIGGKASDSRAIDRASKVGPNTWRFWLSDDAAMRTNFPFVSATGHSQFSTTQRRKVVVTPLSDNQNAAFDGWIKMSSATPIAIHQGTLVEVRANASSLTGTGGTDGKLNIGLANDGTFAIENRIGSAIAVDVTIL